MLEKDIQKSIIDWLRYQGIFCWKNNNVGIYKKETNSYIPCSMKGISDITAILNYKGFGVIMCIEVKNNNGKTSIHQDNFLKNVEESGGISFVARSVEDVENKINEYKKVLSNLWERNNR